MYCNLDQADVSVLAQRALAARAVCHDPVVLAGHRFRDKMLKILQPFATVADSASMKLAYTHSRHLPIFNPLSFLTDR
jgi:hypothetical protein